VVAVAKKIGSRDKTEWLRARRRLSSGREIGRDETNVSIGTSVCVPSRQKYAAKSTFFRLATKGIRRAVVIINDGFAGPVP
jgi:hypothetical protein